jgi:hypothetical protein
MVHIRLLKSDGHEFIGVFEFDHLPRVGEQITIPWESDQWGVRIFEIEEVRHFAKGSPAIDEFGQGGGPYIVLMGNEIH